MEELEVAELTLKFQVENPILIVYLDRSSKIWNVYFNKFFIYGWWSQIKSKTSRLFTYLDK